MKLILLRQNEKLDISSYVTSATLSGDYRSASRTLDFGNVLSRLDPNFSNVYLNLGDNIQLIEGDETLFHGVVWDRGKQTDSNELSYMARDFGIYLNKNKASYNFSSIMPEAIAQKVCKDFGIEVGEIAKTGVKISRKFLGASLYDIIMTAYTLANDKKYMCLFIGKKLNVIEKATLKTKALDITNLLTNSVSESLNEMVNKVNIYNSNNKFIKAIERPDDIKNFGVMTEHLKSSDNDYTLKANKMLKGVSSKIAVTNFGDTSYISGRKVEYTDPYSGKKGLFFIDEDEHNWKNSIYTNKLTLNFENLMDEKEGGSDD